MDKNKQGLSLEDEQLPNSDSPKSALESIAPAFIPTPTPLSKKETNSGTNVNVKGSY